MTKRCHRSGEADAQCAGFTLTELLFVVALIALATMLAAPRLVGPPRHAIVERSAIDLANRLMAVRERARSTSSTQTLFIDVVARSIRNGDGELTLVFGSRVEIEAVGLVGTSGSAGVVRIHFFPDGSTTGGGVWIRGGGRQVRVEVDPVIGAVSVRHDGSP